MHCKKNDIKNVRENLIKDINLIFPAFQYLSAETKIYYILSARTEGQNQNINDKFLVLITSFIKHLFNIRFNQH